MHCRKTPSIANVLITVSDIILSPSQAATPSGEENGHVTLLVTLETETEPWGPGCLLFHSADGPRLSEDRFLGASCPRGSYRATCAIQAAHFLGTHPDGDFLFMVAQFT